jgi:hypothetical protein
MRHEAEAVFLFIAELTGSFKPGSGTMDDKIKCGKKDYMSNNLPELDLNDEEDRKDLHEVVWLERLYNELDGYFEVEGDSMSRGLVLGLEGYREESYKWTVPIELDASASQLQIMGVLLGDNRLMEMTNIIGETLQDPWKLEGMERNMLKKAACPMLYGSSQSCHELWQNNNIKYTPKDIELYGKEMADGAFGVANLLKEFIINSCNPKTEMEVKVWNDTFTISCNRFRNVGDRTKAYKIWDSIDKQYNMVLHTDTHKVPDLEQFRRYFVTLLVHCIDGQIMDSIIEKVMEKYGWGIPIHDAALVSPAAAADVRKWYTEELRALYTNRKEVLVNYFKSIGITGAAKDQWDTLISKVVPADENVEFNVMALK